MSYLKELKFFLLSKPLIYAYLDLYIFRFLNIFFLRSVILKDYLIGEVERLIGRENMEGRNQNKVKNICRDNSLLFLCLGAIWLASGLLGSTELRNISILIFLSGTGLVSSVLQNVKNFMNENKTAEKTGVILSCLTIGMPIGIMLVFFPFIENSNMFFPAFALIQSIIFAVAARGTESKSLWIVSAGLMAISLYSWYFNFQYFSEAAYLASGLLFSIAAYFRILPKLEPYHALQPVKAKSKRDTIPVR